MSNSTQITLNGILYNVVFTPVGAVEPSYNPATDTLILSENFTKYPDTASLKNAYELEHGGDTGIFLDPTGGMNGKPAMRIDWTAQNILTGAGSCQDAGHFLEYDHPAVPNKDHYVQFAVRYQPGFIFDWNYSNQTPCVGNAKKLFLAGNDVGDRFDYICEDHIIHMGRDAQPLLNQNVNTTVTPEMYGDGNWHRVTLHIKQSSTITANDGILEGWIDGVQRWSYPVWQSGSIGGYTYYRMPATFNQGSPKNQSEWMDNWSIWAR